MRPQHRAAVVATLLLAAAATEAHAGSTALRHRYVQPLPPLSGTLHVRPEAFGSGRGGLPRAAGSRTAIQVVRGGVYPSEITLVGDPAGARWATGGTGISGLVGNTGYPYTGAARWGSADSATSGPGFDRGRSAWRQRGLFAGGPDSPFTGTFPRLAGYASASYDPDLTGVGPQLGVYGSGRPSTMAYYGSGSSAGPGGSPGGLATYRSGSYGFAPRVVELQGRGAKWRSQRCTCGPRIVHLRSRHRLD